MSTKEEIIMGIETLIRQNRGDFGAWYVGMSGDAHESLFNEHHVDEDTDIWIYYTAESHDEAAEIEDYFLKTRRTDGNRQGGNISADMIYAYRKSGMTSP